jgi:hypothetical protein
MRFVFETEAVFQVWMFWLKAVAPSNALANVDTHATFHPPMFWLNEEAALNIDFMFETAATFHLPMSALNVFKLEKSWYKLVTALVSQSPMIPYADVAVLGLVAHAVTAVAMLPCVMHVYEQLTPHRLAHPG